jgi:hypothetical protein
MNAFNESATRQTQRHLVRDYFTLTYLVSWAGAFLVASPDILQHGPVSKGTGLVMFPVMLLGPTLIGLTLIGVTDRTTGFMDLLHRMGRFKVSAKWYAVLLLPPAVITVVLFILKTFVSTAFTPNRFFIGFSFGTRTAPRYSIEAVRFIGPVGHRHINFRETFRFPVERYC